MNGSSSDGDEQRASLAKHLQTATASFAFTFEVLQIVGVFYHISHALRKCTSEMTAGWQQSVATESRHRHSPSRSCSWTRARPRHPDKVCRALRRNRLQQCRLPRPHTALFVYAVSVFVAAHGLNITGAVRTPKPELACLHLSDLGFFAVDLSSTTGAFLLQINVCVRCNDAHCLAMIAMLQPCVTAITVLL